MHVLRSSASQFPGNKKSQTPVSGIWQPNEELASQSLRSFDNFSGLDAAGADLQFAVAARRQLNANGLKIRFEPPPGLIVRV